MFVDLHIHTTYSDGTLTPDQVISTAKNSGLSAIAFTDHDCVNALDNYHQTDGLEVIHGVELSAREYSKSVHVLGYFINHKNDELQSFLEKLRKARIIRGEKMVKKLNDYGLEISMKEVKEKVKGDIVGRPHIARVLLEKGIINELSEAFSFYIGDNKPCYVPKPNIPVRKAVRIIKNSGGIPVLAHPIYLGDDDLVFKFIDDGIEGLEVWYPSHRPEDVKRYLKIADDNNLAVTGGSDSHGDLKPYQNIGEFKVDYAVLENLKSRYAALRTDR